MVLGVREAVEKGVARVIHDYDAGRRAPEPLVARLAELGLFGALAGPEHGGLGLSPATAAMIVEEVAPGAATLGGLLPPPPPARPPLAPPPPPAVPEPLPPPMTPRPPRAAPVTAP